MIYVMNVPGSAGDDINRRLENSRIEELNDATADPICRATMSESRSMESILGRNCLPIIRFPYRLGYGTDHHFRRDPCYGL